MKILLIICCAVLATGLGHSDQIYTDLANFCLNNGMVYLSLTSTDEQSLLQNKAQKAYEAFHRHGLRVRRLSYDKLYPELNFDLDTLILLTDTNILSEPNKFQMHLEEIRNHKVRKTILLFVDHFDSNQESKLRDSLNNLVIGNAWFSLMYQNHSNLTKYCNILSLQNNTKTLVQDIEFTESNQIVEKHDLEGLELISNTLSWKPYMEISNCKDLHNDNIGKNCKISGYLNDAMNLMGNIANFTWTSHRPTDDSWGIMDENGVYTTGPMASVAQGEYHLSICYWKWTFQRHGAVDFFSIGDRELVLALTPQPAALDFGLFVRPFHIEAWYLVFGGLLLIVITIIVPYTFLSYYEHTESFKLASLFSWLFFLLINAYYGGALTMFFVGESTLPFNSIEDVMRSYPDWNLKFKDGNDINFKPKADAGDPLYSEFWERVTRKREAHTFQSLEEGLSLIKNERTVIHIAEGALKQYFKDNPYHQQKMKVFSRMPPKAGAIIVTPNSPLKPILQAAFNSLTEAGIKDALLAEWEGSSIPQNDEVETMVLTNGQMILVFLVILFFFGCSILILFGEISYKFFADNKKTRAQKK